MTPEQEARIREAEAELVRSCAITKEWFPPSGADRSVYLRGYFEDHELRAIADALEKLIEARKGT